MRHKNLEHRAGHDILHDALERVADAIAPDRGLFAEVFVACAGKPHSDIKARLAIIMEAKALTEAALVLTACVRPEYWV